MKASIAVPSANCRRLRGLPNMSPLMQHVDRVGQHRQHQALLA
jgi:hypothetical protein